MLPPLSRNEMLRYSRHLLIPEIGFNGQRKLKASSVLIIGAGGLGSPVSLYLSAAGVGRIGLVDFDVVECSNLQRQVIYGETSLGKSKVEAARSRLIDLNPEIHVIGYNEPFTFRNALRIANDYDLIIDGSDNFPTRYLINDVCVLQGKPYIYGSVFRFDGQLSVFDARQGACYRCVFPELPTPEVDPSCAEGGVMGVIPGIIGTLQASEALKILLGVGETMVGRMLIYNSLDLSFDIVRLKKNPSCKICGPNRSAKELIDYDDSSEVLENNREDRLAGNA